MASLVRKRVVSSASHEETQLSVLERGEKYHHSGRLFSLLHLKRRFANGRSSFRRSWILGSLALTLLLCITEIQQPKYSSSTGALRTQLQQQPFRVTFPRRNTHSSSFATYPYDAHKTHRPSYGGLRMESLQGESGHRFQRRIQRHDSRFYEAYRTHFVTLDYSLEEKYENDDLLDPDKCHRVNWRSKKLPVCNTFHEHSLLDAYKMNIATYKGHGHFRDAWLMEPPGQDAYIQKPLRLKRDFDYRDHYRVHRDAIIMERLSPSPRIVDIYGHCGTTILAEHMPYEVSTEIIPGDGHAKQADLDRLPKVPSMNNYTDMQRLEMALIMAEGLADLHGHEGGVIFHGDTHPVQWLRAANGALKLNDFNNGEILDWDVDKQQYCRPYRKFGGMYRAPEEFWGDYVDESIDTFSMGNNIYTLITGLWPFYEDTSYSVIQEKLFDHQQPYVDPRYLEKSYISRRLVEVMKKCWEHKAKKRISIFAVVEELRSILDHEKASKAQTA